MTNKSTPSSNGQTPAEAPTLEQQLDALLAEIAAAEPGIIDAATGQSLRQRTATVLSDAGAVTEPVAARLGTQPLSDASDPAEATAPAPTSEPSAAAEDADVAALADALLAENNSPTTEAPPPPPAAAAAPAPADEGDLAAAIDAAIAAAFSKPLTPPGGAASSAPAPSAAARAEAAQTPGNSDVGEELADQIQNLLDEEAHRQGNSALTTAAAEASEQLDEPAAPVPVEALESAAAEPVALDHAQPVAAPTALDEDADELHGDFESTDAVLDAIAQQALAQTEPALPAAPAHEPTAPAAKSAASAEEDDLVGAFESPEEVVNPQLAQPHETVSLKSDPAAEKQHHARLDARVSPRELPSVTQAAAQAGLIETDDLIEGDFEAPEEVVNPAAQASRGSAAAVATELDADQADDPASPRARPAARQRLHVEPAEERTADDDDLLTPAATPAGTRGGNLLRSASALGATLLGEFGARLPNLLSRTCAILNRPLQRLDPQTRDLIGYVGVISLFWACVVILGKAAAVVFAG